MEEKRKCRHLKGERLREITVIREKTGCVPERKNVDTVPYIEGGAVFKSRVLGEGSRFLYED